MIRFPPPRVTALIKDRPARVLTFAFIVLLWIIFVLPSAFANSLFTLDFGMIFNVVTHFSANLNRILAPYNGRYYPVYWLYHGFLFSLCGLDVRGYYLAQCAIFLLSVLITTAIFTSLVRNTTIVLLFILAIFLSSPNVETLYALGKAEPLVYLFISLPLLLFYRGNAGSKALSLSKCAVIAIAFACSLWSKETSIALFAFPVAGIGAALFLTRSNVHSSEGASLLHRYARFLVCLGCGFGLAKLPTLILASSPGHVGASYTTFSLTWEIIADNVLFYLTQQPDVTVLGIIASVIIILVLRHARSDAGNLDDNSTRDLIFVVSLLVMAWAYLSVFLFWRWSMAYYLYVPAILFRLAAGYGLYMVIRLELYGRAVRIGSYVAMSLLLFHAGIYLWYVGSSQVRYSALYTDALREYVKRSHSADSLIFESYPFYAEQVETTLLLLDLVFHEDRRVNGIADLIDPAVVTPEMRQLLSISDAALANNETKWPKVADFVIVMTGNELATWQLRGVGPYYCEGSFLQKDGSYDLQELVGKRSYFPSLFINVWTHIPDARQTYLGYDLYRVLGGPRFTWLGKFPDGWVGRRARLTLYPEYVANALVHVSTSKYNPHNSVSVFQDDVLIDKASLFEGKEHTFELKPITRAAPTVFRFEVERTFVPKRLHLNRDKRELGAFVRLEPFAAKGK